jgi:hypothetical protein
MAATNPDHVLTRPAAIQTQVQGERMTNHNQPRILVAILAGKVVTSHKPDTWLACSSLSASWEKSTLSGGVVYGDLFPFNFESGP